MRYINSRFTYFYFTYYSRRPSTIGCSQQQLGYLFLLVSFFPLNFCFATCGIEFSVFYVRFLACVIQYLSYWQNVYLYAIRPISFRGVFAEHISPAIDGFRYQQTFY